jgi:hypothetical protein
MIVESSALQQKQLHKLKKEENGREAESKWRAQPHSKHSKQADGVEKPGEEICKDKQAQVRTKDREEGLGVLTEKP